MKSGDALGLALRLRLRLKFGWVVSEERYEGSRRDPVRGRGRGDEGWFGRRSHLRSPTRHHFRRSLDGLGRHRSQKRNEGAVVERLSALERR